MSSSRPYLGFKLKSFSYKYLRFLQQCRSPYIPARIAGVGVLVFLIRQNLGLNISCYGCDADGRVVVIKLDDIGNNIIIFGVYLPCDDHSAEYLNSLQQIIGYIESVIDLHAGCKFILIGDFNFECKLSSRGFCEFQTFAKEFSLQVCDNLDCNNMSYTYNHVSLNHRSLIDHAFVSSELLHCIKNYAVISDGANLSDHLPLQFQLCCSVNINQKYKSPPARKIQEFRWDKSELGLGSYYQETGNLLSRINKNWPCLDNKCRCNIADHHLDIEVYYAEVVHCLIESAKSCIPQIPKAALKHYWSVALDELKHDSRMAYDVWITAGKPRSGQIFDLKKNAHYKYKLGVRDAITAYEGRFTDDLLEYYLHKDMNKFWLTWRKISNSVSPVVSHVEGETDDVVIANKFADFFNISDSEFDLNNKTTADAVDATGSIDDVYEFHEHNFTVEDIDNAIRNNLKTGKAAGSDNIVAEHIIYAHPAIVSHLTKLFNLIILHGYVPNKFSHCIIVPLIKDRSDDVCKLSNYRGISLSPVISKLFEACLSNRYNKFLTSHNLQYGFKKGASCASAVFVMQQTVEYFTKRGSNIYLSALDASKAFDRVNHNILFQKLVARNVPRCLIDIIKNWYSKLNASVRWNGILSQNFTITCGVRQGGVLSPLLFNLYVNDLTLCLELNNLGCAVNGVYLGCIMYADDILLLSTSVLTLQSMLNVCYEYGLKHNILFNSKKSCCVNIGTRRPLHIASMCLGDMSIEWVDTFKYLGVVFVNGSSLHLDCSFIKRKYYAACNAVLVKCKYASDIIKVHLIKTFCLPLLTYCIGALDIPQYKIKDIGVCWNDSFRKIFNFNRWESVAELQYFCGELSFDCIYDLHRLNFLNSNVDNVPVAMLVKLNSHCIDVLSDKYRTLYASRLCNKAIIWQYFSSKFSI